MTNSQDDIPEELNSSTYDFDEQLTVLRLLLQKERYFSPERQWLKPDYETHVKPLVIIFEKFLREVQGILDKDERKRIRLEMLSYLVEVPYITSTYDLTLYQCTCISHFLPWRDTEGVFSLGEGTVNFLTDLQERTESQGVSQASALRANGPAGPQWKDHPSPTMPSLF